MLAASVGAAALAGAAHAHNPATYNATHYHGDQFCFGVAGSTGGSMWVESVDVKAMNRYSGTTETQQVWQKAYLYRWTTSGWVLDTEHPWWTSTASDYSSPFTWYLSDGTQVGGWFPRQEFTIRVRGTYKIALRLYWSANRWGAPSGSDFAWTNGTSCSF